MRDYFNNKQVFFNSELVTNEEDFFFTMIICDDGFLLQRTPSFKTLFHGVGEKRFLTTY